MPTSPGWTAYTPASATRPGGTPPSGRRGRRRRAPAARGGGRWTGSSRTPRATSSTVRPACPRTPAYGWVTHECSSGASATGSRLRKVKLMPAPPPVHGRRRAAVALPRGPRRRAELLERDAPFHRVDLAADDFAHDARVAVGGHAQVRGDEAVGVQFGVLHEDLAGCRRRCCSCGPRRTGRGCPRRAGRARRRGTPARGSRSRWRAPGPRCPASSRALLLVAQPQGVGAGRRVQDAPVSAECVSSRVSTSPEGSWRRAGRRWRR